MRIFCVVLTNGIQAKVNPYKIAYVAQMKDKSIINFGHENDIEVLDTADSIENNMFDCMWKDMQDGKE